jgi:DNA-directed RNA polymerase specialized sigma24 family protein
MAFNRMSDTPTSIRPQLEVLLCDRHSAEARTLYLTLAKYIDRRVARTLFGRYPDVLTSADHEELVGEVLLQLMSGSLARFRGHTIGELLAYVRCICDRAVGHAARKKIRERDTLQGVAKPDVQAWTPASPRPDEALHIIPDSPLSETDTAYLTALLSAGSQAGLAHREGVSRAAVTQRLHRIRDRVAQMSPDAQDTAREWVRETARQTVFQ